MTLPQPFTLSLSKRCTGLRHTQPERFQPERFQPERFQPERFQPERFQPERFLRTERSLGLRAVRRA